MKGWLRKSFGGKKKKKKTKSSSVTTSAGIPTTSSTATSALRTESEITTSQKISSTASTSEVVGTATADRGDCRKPPATGDKQLVAEPKSSPPEPTATATSTSQPAEAKKEEPKKEGQQQQQQQQQIMTDPPPGEGKPAAGEGGGSPKEEPSGQNKPPTPDEDSPQVVMSYDAVPVLEQTKLPRGGVSVDTKAVGRVQFGIPPETIKDSMNLGIPVPQVYIVPVDRFCREMGPALGVNLAEFEFPAYFNFFVYSKRCMLIVDSEDAEENIRRVFSETLLGPIQFRREDKPIAYEEEDFSPDFPRDAIPDFQQELKHFRIMPDGKELVIETLLDFNHFECKADGMENLGIPPPLEGVELSGDALAATQMVDSEDEAPPEAVPKDLHEVEAREEKKSKRWTYSQARFMGDVSVVWPFGTTDEQKKNHSVPRVEVFKMPGGTEYIIHDIDTNNHIIGKARLSGHVKVSEFMSVDGFGGHRILDDLGPGAKKKKRRDSKDSVTSFGIPKTFHPPSFGVTVLGNSHGFDKSGSVSGYVLWINGRGVMIDPPPYSSATLEREGIRPRTIVGIILTHCHADHDAGAFQKVLTGSPVVVITTPTIYKSFIRKYAALSALSPALLRHSHRYKPAIIGEPLRFQGATFHFTYSLHTIPCVGFRVEWRGRSMVFTADHFNSPPSIDKLEASGVLSKGRADDIRHIPLQNTDLLLHEAGAPPIHTPLEVLLELPKQVKKRLYVVHSATLPEGCELKAAPTGTAGTIRLDQNETPNTLRESGSVPTRRARDNNANRSLGSDEFTWQGHSEYEDSCGIDPRLVGSSFAHLEVGQKNKQRSSVFKGGNAHSPPPLVSLRPASSTDAWFILNLLSAVPFLSSLSYTSTMEVLETAKVDAYSKDVVIVPAARRSNVLCVVWEGTCSERLPTGSDANSDLLPVDEEVFDDRAVWHAGDWTGPISLQPDRRLSGESKNSQDHDVVAISSVGVKVITIEFSSLHYILKSGSPLYRKYLERVANQKRAKKPPSSEQQSTSSSDQRVDDVVRDLNVLELLNCNSALRKLTAVQKRHLESLAEGPICYQQGDRLWRAGTPVDKAYLIISGTASFVPKRRNAGSAAAAVAAQSSDHDKDTMGDPGVGDSMRTDAQKAMKELSIKDRDGQWDEHSMSSVEMDGAGQIHFDAIFNKSGKVSENSFSDTHDYEKLSKGLQRRAEYLSKDQASMNSENMSEHDDSHDELDSFAESESQLDYTFTDEADPVAKSRRSSVIRRRSTRARFANKVLGRLYSRRAFTGGLVFSRGHFLGDISKMVAGLVTSEGDPQDLVHAPHIDASAPKYGFGDEKEGTERQQLLESSVADLVIHEQEGDHHIMHSSTLTAGKNGCAVLVFNKASLIPFLDEFPGVLLSLLGTQVVV